jgi:hypothetical protein
MVGSPRGGHNPEIRFSIIIQINNSDCIIGKYRLPQRDPGPAVVDHSRPRIFDELARLAPEALNPDGDSEKKPFSVACARRGHNGWSSARIAGFSGPAGREFTPLAFANCPANSQTLDLPAVLLVDKLQAHHAVVETLRFPAPGDAKLLLRVVSGKFHRHITSWLKVKSSMDTRAAVINRNNLRAVKKNTPRIILPAQDNGDLNRKSAAVPSFAHELGHAYSLSRRSAKDIGLNLKPARPWENVLSQPASWRKNR